MRVLDPLLRRVIALADIIRNWNDESDEEDAPDGSEYGDSNENGYDDSGEDLASSDRSSDDRNSSDGSDEETRRDSSDSDANNDGSIYRGLDNNNDNDFSGFNDAMDIDSPPAHVSHAQSGISPLEHPQAGLSEAGMKPLTGFYQAQSYERYLEVLILQLKALYPLLYKIEHPVYEDPHYTTVQRPIGDLELPHYHAGARPPVYEDVVYENVVHEDVVQLDERPTQVSTPIAGHSRQENLDDLPQIVHNAWMSRVIDARHAERCAARNEELLHIWQTRSATIHHEAEYRFDQLLPIANSLFEILGVFRDTILDGVACLVLSKILECVSVVVGAHRTFQEQGSEFDNALRTRDPDVSEELEKLEHGCEALAHATIIVKIQVSLMGKFCAPFHIPS